MVQLRFLSGRMAGAVWVARHFPVRIGRAASADLRVEEDGVWDQHLVLAFRRDEGFVITAQPEALTTVNGEPVGEAVLRNGDTIEMGAAKLQFWLTDIRQSGVRWREACIWAGIAAIFFAQLGLIYWLLPL